MIEYIALTNFFSFKERTVFSLKATKEKPRGTFTREDWWTEIGGVKLLKAAFLLGNNGSGKTNFLNGLSVLNELITVNRNSKASSHFRLPNVPFLLADETKNAPSAIEVAFHTAGYRYVYYISWKPDYIVEERLSRQEGKKKQKAIFSREFSNEKAQPLQLPSKNLSTKTSSSIPVSFLFMTIRILNVRTSVMSIITSGMSTCGM